MIDAKNLCQKRDCPHAATHAVKLCVPPVAGSPEGTRDATVLLGLTLCEDHLDEADAQAFLDSAGGQLKPLITMGNPSMKPDWPRAYVEGVIIGSPEHQMLANVPRPN